MIGNINARLNRLEQARSPDQKIFEVLMTRDFENAEAVEKYRECVMKEHGDQVFFVTLGIAGIDGALAYKDQAPS